MNDYQEYRSYGSYLSRVFAIIIAFLLLIFTIWAVVRIAGDDEDTLGDTDAPSVSQADGDDPDLFVSDTSDDSSNSDDDSDQAIVVGLGDDDADDDGQTLSTSTDTEGVDSPNATVAGASTNGDDNLPNTGAELSTVFAIGVAAFMGSKLVFRTQEQ